MLSGAIATAASRSLKMRMVMILIFLACLEHVAANPVSGSKTEVVKNPSNILNSTKTDNQVSNTGIAKILDRSSRALTHFAYPDIRKYKENENDMESKEKLESNEKSIYIIPHMRPGRSERSPTEETFLQTGKRDSDTLIPTLRFGRSETSLIPTLRFGRSETSLIPTLRFGRSKTSLIPTPRLGRSVDSFEESEVYLYPDEAEASDAILNDFNNEDTNMAISIALESADSELYDSKLSRKSEEDNGETIIPYSRPGREEETTNEEELPDTEMKRESNDSLIPQIRYGRDSTKVKVPPNQKPYYILPNMRPGRSLKDIVIEKEKMSSYNPGLVPYPRPGRVAVDSEGFNIEELIDAMFVSSQQIGGDVVEDLVDTDNMDNSNLKFFELPKELNKELSKTEQFVIPYPRPGKRDLRKPQGMHNSQPHLFKVKEETNSDYVLPYPRPGKRNDKRVNLFEAMPKMDRSVFGSNIEFGAEDHKNVRKRSADYVEMPISVPFSKLGSSEFPTAYRNVIKNKLSHPNEYDSTRGQSGSIVPYPRPGRTTVLENEDYLIPQLRFGKSNSIVPYPRLGRSNSILPYPRLGRSNSILLYPRQERSDSILPYPRPGRSDSILPYPRLGRSDSILPYPRLGRSDSILPYPRLGRSDSILPYPRLGRSDSILPYPRLGRSDSILPYPRLGRSDSILPYPRLGRSNSLLPYPRFGRSESILPYPRLGRSNLILPYPRLGRSNNVKLYPRPGKSNDVMLPYPKPGRSDSILPYPRLGRFDSILPYPRLGRSDSILPYPRLGRSDSILPYPRLGRSDSILPYPRLGRSKSLLPYPRLGRSKTYLKSDLNEDTISEPSESSDGSIEELDIDSVREYMSREESNEHLLPIDNHNPSKKETEHILTGDSVYLLPYPRPGRSV